MPTVIVCNVHQKVAEDYTTSTQMTEAPRVIFNQPHLKIETHVCMHLFFLVLTCHAAPKSRAEFLHSCKQRWYLFFSLSEKKSSCTPSFVRMFTNKQTRWTHYPQATLLHTQSAHAIQRWFFAAWEDIKHLTYWSNQTQWTRIAWHCWEPLCYLALLAAKKSWMFSSCFSIKLKTLVDVWNKQKSLTKW